MPFITVNNVNLYYEVEGEGEPLLMIQGLGYDHRPFAWLRAELKNHMRLILFDNRGAGRSDAPDGPYTVEQMAGDAAALLDALAIGKAAVLGVSLGGSIAQMMALRHPGKVAKLIVGCSYFSGNPERMKMPQETLELLMKREGTPEQIARRGFAVAFSNDYPARNPEVFEQLVRWRVQDPITPEGYFAQLQAGLGFDIEDEVGNITAPALIIHGDADRVVPPGRGKELAAAVRGSRLEILKDCGHLFFIEQAEDVAGMIRDFVVRGFSPAAAGERRGVKGSHEPWHAHDFVAKRAALHPARTALIEAETGEHISYGMLNERADRLAVCLSGLGIGKGDRVGVLSLNCAAMVELLLACGKIGALFVPFNYRLSADELKGIIADAEVSLFCSDGSNARIVRELEDVLPPESMKVALDEAAVLTGGCVFYASIFEEEQKAGAAMGPRPAVALEDPWIICYTGGTTGTPKGAVLTHGSVLWNAVNTITGWGLREDDVAPVFTPLFHTGGLNVLLTPLLLMGGTSILVSTFDPEKVFDIIDRYGATYVFMVPAMLRMMIRSPLWQQEAFGRVRELVTGGAPCPIDVYEAFAAKGKRFRMGYGLTEAGPNNFHIDPAAALDYLGSVGKPLPFVEARIEGEGGPGAGPGHTGELLLRGGHVFAGYWKKPGETAAVLADGWLRTGDLARRDDEGNFFIVGRKKEMYISGGENVYPAEVEQAVMRHPDVEEAAVVGVPDEKWGESGLGAVVLKSGAGLTGDELKSYLRGKIAHYKVPKRFVFMDELPKTGAGKIDKLLLLKR